ncbi:septal ring lytic transglycosylase RlpA family protein [Candidatus Peregrinibacteria bacterium]|nr:septal ring lytic transglycosylase RlpA family protein [Candidatus Peregrinibacteria bacterium]
MSSPHTRFRIALVFLIAVLLPHGVLAKIVGTTASKTKEPVKSFSDVNENSSFFIPVNYLKKKNLVQGFSDGTFHPERPVTRAEALAMILKATNAKEESPSANTQNIDDKNPIQINFPKNAEITIHNLATGELKTLNNIEGLRLDVDTGSATLTPMTKDMEKPFKDVSQKDWFYHTVVRAKNLGIISGDTKKDLFRPRATVNLAETLRMLFASDGIKTELTQMPVPKGIPTDAWYSKDMAYAVSITMLTQQENGSVFPPDEKLNRGEMALLLYRYLQTKDGYVFGYASWYGDGLAKTKLTSGLSYAEAHLTAAHKTIPFGSIVRVTNMTNGKQVDVVINDRGPYVTGRVIDLSRTAFSQIDSTTVGLTLVKIELLPPLF